MKKLPLTRRGLLIAGAGSAVTLTAGFCQGPPQDPKELTIKDLCNYHTIETQSPNGDLCRVKGTVDTSLGADVLVGLWVLGSQKADESHDDIKSLGSLASDIDGNNWQYENLSGMKFDEDNYVHSLAEYSTPFGDYYHLTARSVKFSAVKVNICDCDSDDESKKKQPKPKRVRRGRRDWLSVIPKRTSSAGYTYLNLSVSQSGHGNRLMIVAGKQLKQLRGNEIRVRPRRIAWRSNNASTKFITSPKGNNTAARSPGCGDKARGEKCMCKGAGNKYAYFRFMDATKSYPQFGIVVHQVRRVHPVVPKVAGWTDWLEIDPAKPIFVQVNDLNHHYRDNSGGFDLDVQVR